MVGCFTDDAFGFRMTALADIYDMIAALHQLSDQIMRARHIRASGIDTHQAAGFRLLLYAGRNTVGGEDHRAPINLFEQ